MKIWGKGRIKALAEQVMFWEDLKTGEPIVQFGNPIKVKVRHLKAEPIEVKVERNHQNDKTNQAKQHRKNSKTSRLRRDKKAN